MENPCILPAQLVIESDIGSRLLNMAALKEARLRKSPPPAPCNSAPPHTLPPQAESTITLAVPALLEHCRRLLKESPLALMQDQSGRSIVRVCDTVDYVIDPFNHRIFSTSADPQPRLFTNEFGMTQSMDTAQTYDRIELLSPLCKPFWLHFVAYRPDGICGHNTDADLFQPSLWADNPSTVHLLGEICRRAYKRLRAEPGFQRLRVALSYRLMEIIGTRTIDLALRSRTMTTGWMLDARDVCRVWRHQTLYERMDHENRQLLPVLSAWLQYRRPSSVQNLDDALPAMRRDLLADGLPPKAWRYLAKHGHRSLTFSVDQQLSWVDLLDVLHQLHRARWPTPPPQGFLRLLHDAAGTSKSYFDSDEGVPGWFWHWACQEANTCANDPKRYRRLRDQVIQWGWLIREYQPRPDSNQLRRRGQWLQKWAQHREAITALCNKDAWGVWLRDIPWQRIERLRVVPLLSPRSLLEEGLAMRNCANRYFRACLRGNCLLLSLRHPVSGKRVALMELERESPKAVWELRELAGPCNRPAPAYVKSVADAVTAMVRQAQQAESTTQAPLCSALKPTSNDQGDFDEQGAD